MWNPKFAIPALLAAGLICSAPAQEVVGRLSIVRDVKVTRGVFNANPEFVNARNGQPIQNRYGVRTLRRSRAQVNFNGDRSILRINELTDIVVYDEATLRRVQLTQGEVWIHVAKGVNTSISTPTLTATARGTEFTVELGIVKVFEGLVSVTPTHGGGREFLVPAGKKLAVDAEGRVSAIVDLSPNDRPQGQENHGGAVTWFNSMPGELGLTVGVIGREFDLERTDPLNEPVDKPTEGALSVVVDRRRRTAWDGIGSADPRRELGLVDDTATNYWFPAGALAATLALDHSHLGATTLPAAAGTVFGFDGSPAFAGVRGDASGTLGRSTYDYEANVLQYYNDPTSNVLGRFGSVLDMQRPLGGDVQAFAGRMKFYEGPVFIDAIDTQLIADRYTAAGLKYESHGLTAEAAYVYDANRYEVGVEPGLMANVDYHLLGGSIGGHLLETSGPAGTGHGRSMTLALPVVPNSIDVYGEYGQGVDGTTDETAGLYFPWLLHHAGVDLFCEYANKSDVAHAISLAALYKVRRGFEVRAGIDWINGTPLGSLGAAWRF